MHFYISTIVENWKFIGQKQLSLRELARWKAPKDSAFVHWFEKKQVSTWTCPHEPVQFPNKPEMFHLLSMWISCRCQFLWRLRVSKWSTLVKSDWLSHMWKYYSAVTVHTGNSQDQHHQRGFPKDVYTLWDVINHESNLISCYGPCVLNALSKSC